MLVLMISRCAGKNPTIVHMCVTNGVPMGICDFVILWASVCICFIILALLFTKIFM